MGKSKKARCLILGLVVMMAFGAMAIPVVAAVIQKQITVATGVNIYVDDTKLNPTDVNGNPVEVFIYNGTTYLPVRSVAEAVGKPVLWDGKTRSVYLGKHDTDEPAVMLHELDYFDRSSEFRTYRDVKDNLGNSYDYGFASRGSGWQTYNINGKYTKMKGKYILSYEYRDTNYENRFKVYGDGKLIYNSTVMTSGVFPIDFEIDLRGVLELKIEIDKYSYGGHSADTVYFVNTGLYQ